VRRERGVKVDTRFERLYRKEFPAVFRTAYLVSGHRQLAEDATQEAFARALERWRRLAGEPWAAGWVTSTAINVAKRALRRRRLPDLPQEGTEMALIERVDLHRAIGALPVRQQQAVILHYISDLPLKDVAQAMGCRDGTVKAHLARARKALATALEGATL
jgi:RNA polymerase sigma-70 factor, ECF subfamily